jgi:fatty acid synthase
LIEKAIELGPVGAIYNLAGVLRDKLFDDLDEEAFKAVLAPKALATKYLDKISRVLCPNLRHFVVFSSVACGRGNMGQSNYSMANSVMERIIEERHRVGLPGKAIQWGAIGDVGMLAEAQLKAIGKEFLGSIPQPILSCFEVLDVLLTSDDPIVSSMIVADKKSGGPKMRNVLDIIFNIMVIRDRKSVSMDSSLANLGIDSLTGVELQQTIEREFDVSLTSQEIRTITLNQLISKVSSKNLTSAESENEFSETERWMAIMMDGVIDNNANLVTTETIVNANDVPNNFNTKVLIIPGLIGYAANVFRNIAKQLDFPASILQLIPTTDCKTLDEIVNSIIDYVLDLFSDADNFVIIGHSFGSLLTLKIAKILEDLGKSGQAILLDGSPEFIMKYALQSYQMENLTSFNNHISMILFNIFQQFVDSKVAKSIIKNHKNWQQRLKAILTASGLKLPFSYDQLSEEISVAYMNRSNIARHLKIEDFSSLETTKISLIKSSNPPFTGLPEDYGLSAFTSYNIYTTTVSGDHATILQNPEMSRIIKHLISN